MSRTRFRKADLTRALKASLDADMKPSQVVIDPTGEMRIIFTDSSAPAGPANPLDRLLTNAPQA